MNKIERRRQEVEASWAAFAEYIRHAPDQTRRAAMNTGTEQPSSREVEVAHSSYQPSRTELNEDMRVEATFEEAVQALARPARVRYVKRPKQSAS